jgi:hypothetical protein
MSHWRGGLMLLLSLLAGCDGASTSITNTESTPGSRLESAARSAGIVGDPGAALQGSWARDTDRICIIGTGRVSRIGVSVDYGEAQSCAASGTVERSGERLQMTFGKCAFDARFDGDRITFPADMPEACEALCAGRASLAAVTVDRLSESRSEAATLRSKAGKFLCRD